MNPIIFFDGYCNLCNTAVDFIIRQDKHRIFRFAALQSEAGNKWLQPFSLQDLPDSVILMYQSRIYTKSEAGIRIAQLMGSPWKYLSLLRFLPLWLRDSLYSWISKNRYRWFGKRKLCRIPSEDEKNLFLS